MKRLRELYDHLRERWRPVARYATEVGDALFDIQLQLWRLTASATRGIADEIKAWADKEQIP